MMGNERRYFYDYYMVCCGPIPLIERVANSDGAVAVNLVFLTAMLNVYGSPVGVDFYEPYLTSAQWSQVPIPRDVLNVARRPVRHSPVGGKARRGNFALHVPGFLDRLVLMAGRASLLDLARRFDVTWFLSAIHKYRYLLTEVMIASFFLQLFGPVSPLFFQVVIDKVLVKSSRRTWR
jgi:hypothetical protein